MGNWQEVTVGNTYGCKNYDGNDDVDGDDGDNDDDNCDDDNVDDDDNGDEGYLKSRAHHIDIYSWF